MGVAVADWLVRVGGAGESRRGPRVAVATSRPGMAVPLQPNGSRACRGDVPADSDRLARLGHRSADGEGRRSGTRAASVTAAGVVRLLARPHALAAQRR